MTIRLLLLESAFAQPEQFHGEIVDSIIAPSPYIYDLVMDGDTLWVSEGISEIRHILAFVDGELVDQVEYTIIAPYHHIDGTLGLERNGDGFILCSTMGNIYHLNRDGTIADSCQPNFGREIYGLGGLTWKDSTLWVGVSYDSIAQLDSFGLRNLESCCYTCI
ncbi:hypothetical protein KKG05_01735 [bacterium]|nr:hypothetical protein [bacterium]